MNYKRLEIYLWWKCNYKCIFCIERRFIDQFYNEKIEEYEILKKLIKYKKLWYNHVTFLGWEPFIQENFLFSLKTAKKLWYKVLVTTNWILLPFEDKAKLYLPFIDELIISIPIIDKNLQPIINWVKNIIDFEKVFLNIEKYWSWNLLKINTVLNKYNYKSEILFWILDFLEKYKNIVSEISFTYPDIDYWYYDEKYCIENLAINYNLIKEEFIKLEKLYKWKLLYKIIDIPFCFLESEKYIKLSDDYNYQERLKIKQDWSSYKNWELEIPRRRAHIIKCKWCKYNKICWWPSNDYIKLYSDSEINPIL